MKKLLLIIAVVPLLMSCSGSSTPPAVVCDLEDAIEGAGAFAIETLLNCNAAAVRASVNSWVSPQNLCAQSSPAPAAKRSLDAGSICSAIINLAGAAAANELSSLVNAKFPTWQCTPSAVVSDATSALSAACSAVFPASMMKK